MDTSVTHRKYHQGEIVHDMSEHKLWTFESMGKFSFKDVLVGSTKCDAGTIINNLTRLGLVYWVPHVFESDAKDAGLILPYAPDCGIDEERKIAELMEGKISQLQRASGFYIGEKDFVLLPAHYENPCMKGVAKLKFRPHTAMSASWLAKLAATHSLMQTQYRLDL